jgi:hypothetical protein
MNDFNSETNSLELAGYWMQQLRECLEMAREKVKDDPEAARCLLRPAAELAGELTQTRASLNKLTEQIQCPVETPSLFN